MTKLTRRAALIAVLPTVAFLSGCQTTASTVGQGGDMNDSDLDFVANASNIIGFDREECTTAQTQARSPEVRALAARLLADANAFDAKLQPLLQETGIRPPRSLRSDLRVRLLHMRLQSGLDFDRTFLEDQIATHEEIINRQRMMSETPGMNPRITQLASAGAEILNRNLAELRRLQQQMLTMKR
jgi:predicted outer membrane protein